MRFTYPPFARPFFGAVVQRAQFDQRFGSTYKLGRGVSTAVNEAQSRKIAQDLADVKMALHFREYQETSNGWSQIAKRKP